MSSSNIRKLNPDKTEFIIFGFNAQFKKFDSHLPVRIFGYFMHPPAIINLGVWFDANVSFADHVYNTCTTSFIQIHGF